MQQEETINLLNVETGKFEGKKLTITNGLIAGKEDATLTDPQTFAIPGLIDSHCHITTRYAPLFTAAGVTSVRNTAGSLFLLAPFFEQERRPSFPHLYTTDRLIDGVPGLWGETNMGSLTTKSIDLAVEEVKRQADLGASFIKVYGRLDRSVMEAVVAEANRHGLEVSADLLGSTDVDARIAAKIGVRFLEHNSGVIQALIPGWHSLLSEDEDARFLQHGLNQEALADLCDELVKSKVVLVPTLSLFAQSSSTFTWSPFQSSSEQALQDLKDHWDNVRSHVKHAKSERLYQLTAEITTAFHQQGGQLLAGTDTPAGVDTFPGQLLHRELELLVNCGLTPLEAIRAATIDPSKRFQLERELNIGQSADFIILNENPLESIKSTQSINRIVKAGEWLQQEDLFNEIAQVEEIYNEKWYESKIAEFTSYIEKNHPQLR